MPESQDAAWVAMLAAVRTSDPSRNSVVKGLIAVGPCDTLEAVWKMSGERSGNRETGK